MTPDSRATARYQKKKGLISKSYKMPREVVEEFAAACEEMKLSHAKVLTKVLLKYHSIKGICADADYRGTFKSYVEDLKKTVDISERIKPVWETFPKRWRVERTFAWLNHS